MSIVRPALAALAFILAGCQSPVIQPLPADTITVALSRPGTLQEALLIATAHVAAVPAPDFHLVAFKGEHLDEAGRSVAVTGSGWHFTFSRYAAPAPATDLQVVEIQVPGVGYTSMTSRARLEATLSPVESADKLLATGAPNSAQLLAPLVAKSIPTNGTTMELLQGIVKVEAASRIVTYSVADGTFSDVK